MPVLCPCTPVVAKARLHFAKSNTFSSLLQHGVIEDDPSRKGLFPVTYVHIIKWSPNCANLIFLSPFTSSLWNYSVKRHRPALQRATLSWPLTSPCMTFETTDDALTQTKDCSDEATKRIMTSALEGLCLGACIYAPVFLSPSFLLSYTSPSWTWAVIRCSSEPRHPSCRCQTPCNSHPSMCLSASFIRSM